MSNRFVAFLLAARWTSAIVAIVYHIRYLVFVDYHQVESRSLLSTAFYFLTGLGHESFAVFFVCDGIVAGLVLLRHRTRTALDPGAASLHLGALYRILLPGLLLGACLDLTGSQFFNGSGLYTAYPEFSRLTLTTTSLLGNLFMLQPFIVPTFGSNGMLNFLSYLFWSFVLLLLFVQTARLERRRARLAQATLVLLVIAVMPSTFLFWAAIWLSGVAVVLLGEARRLRPPLPVAVGLFGAVLLLSRVIGSNAGVLPAPFGEWIVHDKFLLVGLGFAAIARALYPDRSRGHGGWLEAVLQRDDHGGGQTASFIFFFHFPVIMLLVGVGSTLLDRPLMQQPTLATYAEFALLVGACLGMTALAARAVGALARDVIT